MGVSTNAYIAWGIALEEDAELPWDEFDDDIEEWWQTINNYEGPESPFTAGGDWREGYSQNDPRVAAYYDHQREWMKNNPMPFELENTCSNDVPMYFLAVPGTGDMARRGHPKRFDPTSLVVDDDACKRLMDFCSEHGIEYDEDSIGWFLFSYWG